MSKEAKRFLVTFVIEVRNEPVTATREVWAESSAQAGSVVKQENSDKRVAILSVEKL